MAPELPGYVPSAYLGLQKRIAILIMSGSLYSDKKQHVSRLLIDFITKNSSEASHPAWGHSALLARNSREVRQSVKR